MSITWQYISAKYSRITITADHDVRIKVCADDMGLDIQTVFVRLVNQAMPELGNRTVRGNIIRTANVLACELKTNDKKTSIEVRTWL